MTVQLPLSRRARVGVLLVGSTTTSIVAAVLGLALGHAIDGTLVSLPAVQNLASCLFSLCPVAIAHGVLTTLVDRARVGVPTRNPWIAGVGCAFALGAPAALLARPVVAAICPSGASPVTVALLLAAGAVPLAASVIGVITSRTFTRTLCLPPSRPPEPAPQYLVARHAVPVGLFNAAVSLAAAFALCPGASAPLELMASDAAASFVLIALFVGPGAVTHARGDLRSGLVLPRGAAPFGWSGILRVLGVTLGCVGAMLLALRLGGVTGVSLGAFAAWRALAFGGFAALVALLAARRTLAAGATRRSAETLGATPSSFAADELRSPRGAWKT